MNTEQFLQTIQEIFQKEGVVEYDKELFKRFSSDKENKNSLVTTVKLKTGETLFFKAIKPWTNPHRIMDYKKGIMVDEILKKATATDVVFIKKNGRFKNIFYLLSEVAPVEAVLNAPRMKDLTIQDGKKIIDTYRSNQKKIRDYLSANPDEATLMYPHSLISQSFSYLAMILLFEESLNVRGLITTKKATQFVMQIINDKNHAFFSSKEISLVHGDFAPHNIIYDRDVYIIDWEKAFSTFNSIIADEFDVVTFYISAFKNKPLQQLIVSDSLSFKLNLIFQILSKVNNMIVFETRSDEKDLFDWCIEEYGKLFLLTK